MSHPNEQMIQKFYESFQARDAAGMIACYDPDVVFTDPAFGRLEGTQTFAMWRMLCSRAKDLEITFSNIIASDNSGSAHWEAKYTFGKTGRRVHNRIEAEFLFRNGKMVKHTDKLYLLNNLGMASHRPEGLRSSTSFFKKTFGTFPFFLR